MACDIYWTYKILRMGADGKADWLTAELKLDRPIDAARAAAAYMVAHADRGEMAVVSLEPSPELKPVVDRMREHQVMLDTLKIIAKQIPTRPSNVVALIREIDPYWIDPHG